MPEREDGYSVNFGYITQLIALELAFLMRDQKSFEPFFYFGFSIMGFGADQMLCVPRIGVEDREGLIEKSFATQMKVLAKVIKCVIVDSINFGNFNFLTVLARIRISFQANYLMQILTRVKKIYFIKLKLDSVEIDTHTNSKCTIIRSSNNFHFPLNCQARMAWSLLHR